MGCGTESSTQQTWNNNTTQTTFNEATPEEKRILAEYGALGDQQRLTLQNLMDKANGQGSMFTLTPEDQAKVDTAFGSARNQLETGMRDFADFNAGSRGMRMSDVPVAQQALQRYGLGLSDLESQKANALLNYGLQANQARMGLGLDTINSLPSGYGAAFTPLFNERMASGRTTTTGYGLGTSVYNPSILQQMNQGAQFRQTMHAGTNQAMQAGGNFMKMGFM